MIVLAGFVGSVKAADKMSPSILTSLSELRSLVTDGPGLTINEAFRFRGEVFRLHSDARLSAVPHHPEFSQKATQKEKLRVECTVRYFEGIPGRV